MTHLIVMVSVTVIFLPSEVFQALVRQVSFLNYYFFTISLDDGQQRWMSDEAFDTDFGVYLQRGLQPPARPHNFSIRVSPLHVSQNT